MTRRLFVTAESLFAEGEPPRPAPGLIPALWRLREAGYALTLLREEGDAAADLLRLLDTQGIIFDAILPCDHPPGTDCVCRKPHLGRLRESLVAGDFDVAQSRVIGRGPVDEKLAENAGLGVEIVGAGNLWSAIADRLIRAPRAAEVERVTKETTIRVRVTLDREEAPEIATGLGYFDHMLEQIAKHGGMGLRVQVKGDLHVDEHHTVEDTALVLGQALRRALGDKRGIGRYGFVLPMDEASAHADLCLETALDLSGRPFFLFEGKFPRERVGELPTELVPHFFRSLSETLGATLHLRVQGENAHHMVEACFKAVGRAWRAAAERRYGASLPSTKGCL